MKQAIRLVWAATLFNLAAAGQTPAGQAPAPQHTAEPCSIEGAVVNAVAGQPVRKAHLMLMPTTGGEAVQGLTDSQGHYRLANLAPGSYQLRLMHDGYLPQIYGARKPGDEQKGESLDLIAGAVKTEVNVQMTPLGVIMGHIRDEDGDPVRQVEVAILAYGHSPAGKALQLRGSSMTDASGEYRLFDLPPGRYYLRARPVSSQMPAMVQAGEAYATMFYPNTTQPTGATAIDLSPGQEQRGLDFVMHVLSTASVRGRVTSPPGGERCVAALEGLADTAEPVDGVVAGFRDMTFTVSDHLPDGIDMEELIAGGRKVDKDGKFEFRNIPVGAHSLTANCRVGKQRYSTKVPIQLEAAGLENLELRPVGPSNLSGQLQLEGESKSKIAETHLALSDSAGGTVNGGNAVPDGAVGEDGAFAFHEVPPGLYHLRVDPPPDLYVKSVTWSGRDIVDPGVDLSSGGMSVEIQVILSANGGTVEGSVENGEGAKVVLIPSDPQRVAALAKLVVAQEGGHFSFQAIPPGRYKVFAWEDADNNQALYDPEFRKPFESKSEIVDVQEKQKSTVQLKLIPREGN